MDLANAFVTLPRDILIAKLYACGVGNNIFARIGLYISDWLLVLLEILQGSILALILFNIFINDLLLLRL